MSTAFSFSVPTTPGSSISPESRINLAGFVIDRFSSGSVDL
jgi:hypothetical protein